MSSTARALTIGVLVVLSAHDARGSTRPEVVAVSPGEGQGAGRTFRFFYADADGASDIAAAEVVIVSGTELTGVSACFIHAAGNGFWLRDDLHSTWLGPVIAGRAGRLANSQCALASAGSSMSSSANSLTMTVTVTFTTAFAGPKSIYMEATDRAGLSSGWQHAGTWTVLPLNPGLDVVTSSCSDSLRDDQYSTRYEYEQGDRVVKLVVMPACFPTYSFSRQEGFFLEDRRPVPVMGRTAGQFDVLVAFTDTDVNRRELLDNQSVPASVKAKIEAGQIRQGLEELFESYTPEAVMDAFLAKTAAQAVAFSFTVAVTQLSRLDLETRDDGLGFARYDAVVLLDDLRTYAGYGVRRWPVGQQPVGRVVFHGKDAGYILNVDPGWLTPGLFGNELLRRNIPTLLSEYLYGEHTLVTVGGITYDRTPIVNPRTGENIEPLIRANEGKTPIGAYIAGYADVDNDGVVDGLDPEISPAADNMDGDFIPDRFDPDLRFSHRPYSWMYAARF